MTIYTNYPKGGAGRVKALMAGLLDRLKNKNVFCTGRYDWCDKGYLDVMCNAHQAVVQKAISSSTDYLIVPTLKEGVTAQKQAASLNKKGASIQVIDFATFKQMTALTYDEVLKLMRAKLPDDFRLGEVLDSFVNNRGPRKMVFQEEDLAGVSLNGCGFRGGEEFVACNWKNARLRMVDIGLAKSCDFSGASGYAVHLYDVEGSRFVGADFSIGTGRLIAGCNFTSARLSEFRFGNEYRIDTKGLPLFAGCVFKQATLEKCVFNSVRMDAPDFSDATFIGTSIQGCEARKANFRNAKLCNATIPQSDLRGADFSGADLTDANLVECDLTDANFDRANLTRCNLGGAKLKGAKLEKAIGYTPAKNGKAGPALKRLDAIQRKAAFMSIQFRIQSRFDGKVEEMYCSTDHLRAFGRGVRATKALELLSEGLIFIANSAAHWDVLFQTVTVSCKGYTIKRGTLHDIVLEGLAEAFATTVPKK